MRIAAVVTAYNSAETITRALESVFQQTRPADAVIVVDDGSTDDTLARVRAFEGVRIITRLNGGAAAARNSGISAALDTGADWIAFLDGDDAWLPEKLAFVAEAAAAYPEAAVLYSSVLAVEGHEVAERTAHAGDVLGVEELLAGCPILTPSSAVLNVAALATVGGFNERRKDGEDWEFWLRLAEHGPIRRMEGPLAVYYIHPGGIHTRYVATRRQATRFVTLAGLRYLRRRGPAALPALRRAFAAHFGAFTYYASLERRIALTAVTGAAAALMAPVRGGYAAGRSLVRAVTGA
jgi:glycosyltransferase involved in cell wall biosynthesis